MIGLTEDEFNKNEMVFYLFCTPDQVCQKITWLVAVLKQPDARVKPRRA
jgi:hypothetical protein